jgi:hypothetical protein
MEDWLAVDRENAKEYRNGRFMEQPPSLGFREIIHGRSKSGREFPDSHPRLELQI